MNTIPTILNSISTILRTTLTLWSQCQQFRDYVNNIECNINNININQLTHINWTTCQKAGQQNFPLWYMNTLFKISNSMSTYEYNINNIVNNIEYNINNTEHNINIINTYQLDHKPISWSAKLSICECNDQYKEYWVQYQQY